jgi:hypothetical protein
VEGVCNLYLAGFRPIILPAHRAQMIWFNYTLNASWIRRVSSAWVVLLLWAWLPERGTRDVLSFGGIWFHIFDQGLGPLFFVIRFERVQSFRFWYFGDLSVVLEADIDRITPSAPRMEPPWDTLIALPQLKLICHEAQGSRALSKPTSMHSSSNVSSFCYKIGPCWISVFNLVIPAKVPTFPPWR